MSMLSCESRKIRVEMQIAKSDSREMKAVKRQTVEETEITVRPRARMATVA